MDATTHQITCCIINHAVAGDGVFAGKGYGDDIDVIVAAAATCTDMSGMQVGVVADGQRRRLQGGSQALLQQVDGFAAHAGRAFLKGLTVTFS